MLRFVFGALTGVVLVASGMVLSSAIFPTSLATDAVEPVIVLDPTEVASGQASEAEPSVTEPEQEPASAITDAGQTEAAAGNSDPAAGTEATSAAEKTTIGAEPVVVAEPGAESTTTVGDATQPQVSETSAVLPTPPEEDQSAAALATAILTAPDVPKEPAALALPATDPAVVAEDGSLASPSATTSEAQAPEIGTAEAPPVDQPEPATAALAESAPGADIVPAAEADADAAADPATESAADAPVATAEAKSSTFAPTPGFSAGGTISDTAAEDESLGESALAEADAAKPADARPIAAYAARFDNPDAKPVLAIVLIDTGAADLDRAALASLPFPVSFALDPMDPATPDHAAIYRAAGREVIMLATGIADGAQASDVEVAFQSMAQRLPEAVAVMDLAMPLFQNNRPLASLVVPVIAAEGRGVLSWDKGLNAADQVARRDDVASAVIFRDLAVGGGDAAAAKRTLDRAVFKAGQDGRVVVAGEITDALVSALLEWTVEGRAGAIALGPVTAVLQVD